MQSNLDINNYLLLKNGEQLYLQQVIENIITFDKNIHAPNLITTENIEPLLQDVVDGIYMNVYTITQVNEKLALKADADNVYDKEYINTEFINIRNEMSYKADSDSVYDKTQVYTKQEVEDLISGGTVPVDAYTKEETNNLLNFKADKAHTYTRDELYTRTECDEKFSGGGGTIPDPLSINKLITRIIDLNSDEFIYQDHAESTVPNSYNGALSVGGNAHRGTLNQTRWNGLSYIGGNENSITSSGWYDGAAFIGGRNGVCDISGNEIGALAVGAYNITNQLINPIELYNNEDGSNESLILASNPMNYQYISIIYGNETDYDNKLITPINKQFCITLDTVKSYYKFSETGLEKQMGSDTILIYKVLGYFEKGEM